MNQNIVVALEDFTGHDTFINADVIVVTPTSLKVMQGSTTLFFSPTAHYHLRESDKHDHKAWYCSETGRYYKSVVVTAS